MQRLGIHQLETTGTRGPTTVLHGSGEWKEPAGGSGTGLPVIDVVADHGAAVDGATDDTAAWQAAIDAAGSAGGGRIISSRSGVSIIAGPLQPGADSQLVLPAIDYVDGEQVSITIAGAVPPPPVASVIGNTPIPDNHLVLKSTLTAGAGGAVLGGVGPAGTLEGFTNVMLRLENLTVRTPANPVITGLNLSKVAAVDLDNVVVDAGSYHVQGLAQPTTSSSYGIRLPANNNGAFTRLGAVNVVGFYNGYEFAEHSMGQQVAAWGCRRAFVFVATNHASKFQRLMAVHCQEGMVFLGTHYVDVDQFNVEHAASGWWVTTADVQDPSNYGHGSVTWHVVKANVGIDATFVVNGGSGLRVARMGSAVGGSAVSIFKGRDRLVAVAGADTLTLGASPVALSPLVWVNGAITWPGVDYTIADDVITFAAALAAGDVVAVIYDTTDASPSASTLSAPVAPGTIADNFDRANDSASIGSTSTGAKPWANTRGGWGIDANRATVYSDSSTGGVQLATIDSGLADCAVSVKIAAKASTAAVGGLYLRATDGNNGYIVELGQASTGGTTKLYRWQNGAATVIGQSAASVTFAAGDVMEAVLSGSSITVKKNGVELFTATDSTFLTQTRHGLYSAGWKAVYLDEFSVTG